MTAPVVVWRFTDGKAGHENQSAGLLAALRERVPVDDYQLQAAACRPLLASFINRRLVFGQDLPGPDLIIGAGHATHLPMLAARRARGGRVIVLMKPSLPLAWFDLCVVPAHDKPRKFDNVLVTQGVLNTVRYNADKNKTEGLILIGGPSAHVDWSSRDIVRQVSTVLDYSPEIHWTLTSSRRTPIEFMDILGGPQGRNITIVPFEKTAPGWLSGRLATAACVWATADSVSMVYEALTSGAAFGLLSVSYRKANDRLARGLQELEQAGLVMDFESWRRGGELRRPIVPLDEAGRCADRILEKWPVGS